MESTKTKPTLRTPSELLDRMPPADEHAERAVIGSLLLDGERADDVALVLRASDFYSPANADVFGACMDVCGGRRRLDVVTLRDRLAKANKLEAIGGMTYLGELAQAVPTASNAIHYADIVREKAMLRDLIHASGQNIRDAYDGQAEARDVLASAEQSIMAIAERQVVAAAKPMRDVMFEALDELDARKDGKRTRGISTGYHDLDAKLGGLRPSELIVLAARPSMGKSALASNIAEHVGIKLEMGVLFVSLEMSALSVGERMLSSISRVPHHKLAAGMNPGEREEVNRAAARIGAGKIQLDDAPTRNVLEIAALARRMKRRDGLALVVVDYLQLIRSDHRRESREQEVSAMSRALKALARDLAVPVLCLAQLNRQAEVSTNNIRKLSHLRESGAIEQDADVVMFVHRPEYYVADKDKGDLKGQATIIVAKQRNGPTGDVKMMWHETLMRFENAVKGYGHECD